MKKHFVRTAAAIASIALLISGCGRTSPNNDKNIEDLTADGMVERETSAVGIDSSSKDFESLLTNNTFYIVHEGIYYPLYSDGINIKGTNDLMYKVDPTRQMYFSTETADNVPTFFPGDHLVYFSKDTLLDYVSWERYYDLGYTVGLMNLKKQPREDTTSALKTRTKCRFCPAAILKK